MLLLLMMASNELMLLLLMLVLDISRSSIGIDCVSGLLLFR